MEQADAHFKKTGKTLMQDIVEKEVQSGDRIYITTEP